MRVLFVSGELIAGDVAYRLKKEGCDVKLYTADKSRKDCFDGIVEKVNDWEKELDWVGKDGLIVFDDVIHGEIQDDLIKKGYTVFGGCEKGSELERNREFAQKLFSSHGMHIEDSIDFSNINDAISHIEQNKSKWVVKQNGHAGSLSYVGVLDDGSDAVSILKSYQKYNKSKDIDTISLQKSVDGVEVAVGRFFNGTDWTSPIFISFEHKPFLNDDIGPLTAEMGTLAWYERNDDSRLFKETLVKIKPYLQSIDYRGYVDINSIVNKDRLVPLEATMRFGSPTNHMQSDMHLSSWTDLLHSTAKGEPYSLQVKDGFTIVVSVAIPPFPYASISDDYYSKGVEVLFKEKLTEEELSRLHFEEVSYSEESGRYYVAGSNGYILFITGNGDTVMEARNSVYKLVNKIVLPKMMYRTDIGVKFIERDEDLLVKWGWL